MSIAPSGRVSIKQLPPVAGDPTIHIPILLFSIILEVSSKEESCSQRRSLVEPYLCLY